MIRAKEQETSVIKKKQMTLYLLEIIKLMGGATLDFFLKAYKASEAKLFFPYEWFDNPGKLDFPELPSYDAFFSKLRNTNLLDKDFKETEKLQKSENDEQQAPRKLQVI